LYGNHPYARQTFGTPESVKKATLDDLRKLHADWVHPENIAVGFCGDITSADALKLVSAQFGALKAGELKAPAVPPIPALTKGLEGEGAKEGIKGAVLTLGFRGADLKNPDRETLDLLANLLSGLGGRLSVALREKQGLAYSVGVHNDAQLDGGALIFFIQTDAKSLAVSLEGMWKEIKLLRDEPVPEKELASIKSFLAGSEAIELQNQTEVAQRLALSQLFGEGAAHVFSRKQRLEKVTPQILQDAARKYLDPDHWAKAVLKAKE
jgi:zinc protease